MSNPTPKPSTPEDRELARMILEEREAAARQRRLELDALDAREREIRDFAKRNRERAQEIGEGRERLLASRDLSNFDALIQERRQLVDQNAMLEARMASLRAQFESRQGQLSAALQELKAQYDRQLAQNTNDAKLRRELEDSLTQTQRQLSEVKKSEINDWQLVLADRLRPEAIEAMKSDQPLRDKFKHGSECDVFVLSVDIRRSTELMLQASSPGDFARFITELCRRLQTVITNNFGVYDKFTGDGVLAFFPCFFAGADVDYYAVRASEACHNEFSQHFRESRDRFDIVNLEVGLGIGMDFGSAQLVHVNGALTIVGRPVVYACRMGSAPAGVTFVNQSAYRRLKQTIPRCAIFTETRIDVKHQGSTLAYALKVHEMRESLAEPDWFRKHSGRTLTQASTPNPGTAGPGRDGATTKGAGSTKTA